MINAFLYGRIWLSTHQSSSDSLFLLPLLAFVPGPQCDVGFCWYRTNFTFEDCVTDCGCRLKLCSTLKKKRKTPFELTLRWSDKLLKTLVLLQAVGTLEKHQILCPFGLDGSWSTTGRYRANRTLSLTSLVNQVKHVIARLCIPREVRQNWDVCQSVKYYDICRKEPMQCHRDWGICNGRIPLYAMVWSRKASLVPAFELAKNLYHALCILTSLATVSMPFMRRDVPYLSSLFSRWLSTPVTNSLLWIGPDHMGPAI